MDDLLKKHNYLTKKLKSICYLNGKEINPKRSAKIIHKLGQNYQKIADCYYLSKDRHQKNLAKLAWIRSAVLLNAAIIRKPQNVEDIKKDLQRLCTDLCMISGAANKNSDLVAKAKLQFLKVTEMRTMVGNKLKELEQNDPDRDLVWAKKIEELQNQIACQYTKCMHDIMKCCVQIMGDPPCKYALVGMGSLARKEITPFSDFENIIILQEGIQDMPNYEKKIEYFQWVATLFQVIMVNMGETIIRFVNIPGLNNPYDKHEDWFFDAHTPCGISPDGFAPHACKNPLGRQEWTKEKPWTTELIKPVSVMLNYLKTEEDLKNGYHIADVLTKTCFVSGSKELYDDFSLRVWSFPCSKEQSIKTILEDVQNLKLANNCLIKVTNSYDLKKLAYRTMSQHMLAIGCLAKLKAITAFEIAQDLGRGKSKKVHISSEDSKCLVLAAAIACEIRLRLYIESKGQEDVIVTQNDVEGFKIKRNLMQDTSNECITNSLKLEKLTDFFKTLEAMRRLVLHLLENREPHVVQVKLEIQPGDERVVESFGMSDKIIQFYYKQLDGSLNTNDWLHENLAFQFFKRGDLQNAHLHAAARANQFKQLDVERFMPHMAYSMYLQKYEEFIEDIRVLQRSGPQNQTQLNKILEFLRLLWETVNSIHNNFQVQIMNPFKQFVERVYEQISGNAMDFPDITTSTDYNIHTKIEKTSEITLRCLQFANKNTKHFKQAEYDKFLKLANRVFLFYSRKYIETKDLNEMNALILEVMQTYNIKQIVTNIMMSPLFKQSLKQLFGVETKAPEAFLQLVKGFCYFEFFCTNYNTALKLYKLLEMFTGWFIDPLNYKSVENKIMADTLHQIARCLWLLKHDNAMEYLKQEITFRKQITENSAVDAAIARCYFLMAMCSLNDHLKCKKYLLCAKTVWETADPIKWKRLVTVSTVLLKWLDLMSKHEPSEVYTESKQMEEMFSENQCEGHYEEEFDNIHEHFIQLAESSVKTNNHMSALLHYRMAKLLYVNLCGNPDMNVIFDLGKKISNCLQCFEVYDDLD